MNQPALPTAHETTASTGVEAHGPTSLGLSAEGWVYVGLTIFILLAIFVGKAPKRIADILDLRIADTRRHLDEAKAIRAEAEGLLAQANTLRADAAKNAEIILRSAEAEAAAVVTKAQADSRQLVERRTRMAEDKIGAAERAAVAEVRQRAVNAATRAAATLIADRHDAAADKAMTNRAIAGLSRLN